jgi:uncharacterized protein
MSKRFAKLRHAVRPRRRGASVRRPTRPLVVSAALQRRPVLLFTLGLGLGVILSVIIATWSFQRAIPAGGDLGRAQLAQATHRSLPQAFRAGQHLPAASMKPTGAPLPAEPSAPPSGHPQPPAWQQYARAAPASDGHPVIAIVIDDMGIDKADSARIIALPGPITIAFMTYAGELEAQARAARAAGHELWLHVPMEPLDGGLDSGPYALKTGLPPEENRRRLDWALSRMDGYVGINNHMGSRFTASSADMALVLQIVKARGLAFLDSRTTASTVAGRMAAELGIPHIDRDVFIDNDETVDAVLTQLAHAERLAEKRGYALAIGHPHATTITALTQWLPTLRSKGLVLVPASALLRLQIANAG